MSSRRAGLADKQRVARIGIALVIATASVACARHPVSNIDPAPLVPTVVAVRNADLGADATSIDIVLVVRDVDQPDRAVQEAVITLTSSVGGSKPSGRAAVSRADGVAILALSGGESSVLLVRRVGYSALKVVVTVRPHCRQVLEVYIAQDLMRLDGTPGPSSPRATLTTCAPPA